MAKSDNEERRQRILNAAADLFVHFGYDKTTVDDIARRAGVSKGAIYLHFESKDALFEGLLIRELKRYTETWMAGIEADPDGGTIAGMYRNMLHALSSSPFMSAVLKQDQRLFGNYLRRPGNFFRRFASGGVRSPRHEFVHLMQEAGAVRKDIDAKVVAHIMNMLAYGLVGMEDVVEGEEIPPTDVLIEGIAALMERGLAPEGDGNPDAGKRILRQLVEAARRQFESLETANIRSTL